MSRLPWALPVPIPALPGAVSRHYHTQDHHVSFFTQQHRETATDQLHKPSPLYPQCGRNAGPSHTTSGAMGFLEHLRANHLAFLDPALITELISRKLD